MYLFLMYQFLNWDSLNKSIYLCLISLIDIWKSKLNAIRKNETMQIFLRYRKSFILVDNEDLEKQKISEKIFESFKAAMDSSKVSKVDN